VTFSRSKYIRINRSDVGQSQVVKSGMYNSSYSHQL